MRDIRAGLDGLQPVVIRIIWPEYAKCLIVRLMRLSPSETNVRKRRWVGLRLDLNASDNAGYERCAHPGAVAG